MATRKVYEFSHYCQYPIDKVRVSTFLSVNDALRQYLEIHHEGANVGTLSLSKEGEGVWSYQLGPKESVWIRERN